MSTESPMMEIWLEILMEQCNFDWASHTVKYDQFYFREMKGLAKDCLIRLRIISFNLL